MHLHQAIFNGKSIIYILTTVAIIETNKKWPEYNTGGYLCCTGKSEIFPEHGKRKTKQQQQMIEEKKTLPTDCIVNIY